ncbi:hypothetical protein R1sor_001333 [Riccia sorocarpa]|uniref:Uncharacterized protein n=1 Tax=Riccia sorocarpa TaxID=122646 RepID=A0ABD3GXL1_9MARC
MSPGIMVTQLAQGIGVLAGAWAIKSIMDAENEKPMAGGGQMRCNSCGGSGTGRPLPVQIQASNIPGGSRRP